VKHFGMMPFVVREQRDKNLGRIDVHQDESYCWLIMMHARHVIYFTFVLHRGWCLWTLVLGRPLDHLPPQKVSTNPVVPAYDQLVVAFAEINCCHEECITRNGLLETKP
jgi:hypothetical protein